MKADNDTANEPVPAEEVATPQPGPGSRLAKARIAANKSVDEVATSLNLTVGVVEALERDDAEGLPAPVFVRGYIKNYARLVGLNGNELVDRYDAERAPEVPLELRPRPASETAPMPTGVPLRAVAIILVLVLAGVAGWWWWTQGGRDVMGNLPGNAGESPTVALPAEPVTPDVVVVPETGPAPVAGQPATSPEPITGMERTAPGGETPASAQPAVREDGAAPDAATVQSAAPAPAPEPEPEPPAPTGHTLGLTLSDDVWVEVVDSEGTRLVFDMLRAGTTREVTGEVPFLILLGKSGAVDVELDGRPVDHASYDNKGI
ncbi:MAG: DUF4115 domain-containing protein, partial [Gammaproteobacteria bacterium]|nr:DUF4115 domain-containing protein [Gammaproteobacteria bacterium]